MDEFLIAAAHLGRWAGRHAGRQDAVAMGRLHSPEAVPRGPIALNHEEPLIRRHAVYALGRIGTEARQALRGEV